MFDNAAALTPGTLVDFGLDDSNETVNRLRYAALQRAVRTRGITADRLHAAANFPVKLNAIVNDDVSFDGMKGELPMPVADDA